MSIFNQIWVCEGGDTMCDWVQPNLGSLLTITLQSASQFVDMLISHYAIHIFESLSIINQRYLNRDYSVEGFVTEFTFCRGDRSYFMCVLMSWKSGNKNTKLWSFSSTNLTGSKFSWMPNLAFSHFQVKHANFNNTTSGLLDLSLFFNGVNTSVCAFHSLWTFRLETEKRLQLHLVSDLQRCEQKGSV